MKKIEIGSRRRGRTDGAGTGPFVLFGVGYRLNEGWGHACDGAEDAGQGGWWIAAGSITWHTQTLRRSENDANDETTGLEHRGR
jgi:hypothetical protein